MTDNEFLLFDRITKIQSVINQYGEDNFYISYSGGKDSTVLHELVDMALPDNRIPRVYANTGIELNMVRDFVKAKAEKDDRIIIVKPSKPIKKTLEEYGYPFKSKFHAHFVALYQRLGLTTGVKNYMGIGEKEIFRPCPKILQYQFTEDFNMKVSDKCCFYLKEEPLDTWAKENAKTIALIGVMKSEGGRRTMANCLAFNGKKLKAFQPLVPITKEWEEWFIEEHNIEICDIYKPPYNFTRTGCKGCPFALNLQEELDTLQEFFPNERKQCEAIWKPVYDEYRRLNYRLTDGGQMKWF